MQYIDLLPRFSQPPLYFRTRKSLGQTRSLFTARQHCTNRPVVDFPRGVSQVLDFHALSGKRDRLTNRRLAKGVKFLVKPTREVNIVIMHFFTQARYTIRCLLRVIFPDPFRFI